MIDENEVLKILKRYEGRMNPTAYFSGNLSFSVVD